MEEPDPDVIDRRLKELNGHVIRWPCEQVEAQLRLAADAVAAAEREIRRVPRGGGGAS